MVILLVGTITTIVLLWAIIVMQPACIDIVLVVFLSLGDSFWSITQWFFLLSTPACIAFVVYINDKWRCWTGTIGKLLIFQLSSHTDKLLVLTCCKCGPLCLDSCVIRLLCTFHWHDWVDFLIILYCHGLLCCKFSIHLCNFSCWLVQLILYDRVVSHTNIMQWIAIHIIGFYTSFKNVWHCASVDLFPTSFRFHFSYTFGNCFHPQITIYTALMKTDSKEVTIIAGTLEGDINIEMIVLVYSMIIMKSITSTYLVTLLFITFVMLECSIVLLLLRRDSKEVQILFLDELL